MHQRTRSEHVLCTLSMPELIEQGYFQEKMPQLQCRLLVKHHKTYENPRYICAGLGPLPSDQNIFCSHGNV